MSTYLTTGEVIREKKLGEVLLPEGFADKFPEVSAVFSGKFNEETRFWTIPPASITLFVEGLRLKFVCNPRGFGQVLFGTVSNAITGLEGVDEALRLGQCEWKGRSVQKSR